MFLVQAGEQLSAAAWDEASRQEALHPGEPDAVRAAMDAWFEEHPMPPASVTDVADHVDHVRDVAGIDHVGIGSDFDGVSAVTECLDDVSTYPNLFAELLRRGYSDEELAKISRHNVLRVMREAERTAERLRRERPPSLARIDDREPEVAAAVPEEEQQPGIAAGPASSTGQGLRRRPRGPGTGDRGRISGRTCWWPAAGSWAWPSRWRCSARSRAWGWSSRRRNRRSAVTRPGATAASSTPGSTTGRGR